jgi:CheY-like chemotaxis protein
MGIKVPIIALTAHSFKAEIDRCMDAGMNDYIIKPYNEKGLMETILANIHGTGLRENHEQEPEKIQAKTPMYDLGNILKFSRGNQEFIKKMIVMFIEQSPVALHNIKIALEGNDMEAVKKIAHKVKPTFDNFCNVSLMQNIRIVESLASQKAAAEDFNNYILQMEEVLEEVIQGLKKEIRD